uniref:Crystaline entomocidal protoxin n=1 Tax=Bacillus thuringiensis TaxID=1428 RepID=Q9EVR2_BACTU|nr:parasporin 1 [Bacillus thuringiensis]BAB11757.1 81-kDa leukemia toxin [Bacillus thuringiensis]BAE79808.1 Cry31-like 81-kDa protein [Bacillus thuringiensis]
MDPFSNYSEQKYPDSNNNQELITKSSSFYSDTTNENAKNYHPIEQDILKFTNQEFSDNHYQHSDVSNDINSMRNTLCKDLPPETNMSIYDNLRSTVTVPSFSNQFDPIKFLHDIEIAIQTGSFSALTQSNMNQGGTDINPMLISTFFKVASSLLPFPLSSLGALASFYVTDSQTGAMANLWRQMVDYVEKRIDSKILDYHNFIMGAELAALNASLKEYARVVKIFENDMNRMAEPPSTGVITQFRILNDNFIKYIAKLQFSTNQSDLQYPVLTLPLRAQACVMHLMLLKDATTSVWGQQIDSQQLNGYKAELIRLIKVYTNDVNTTYNQGLELEKAKPLNYSDPEEYLQAGRPDISVLRSNFKEVMKWNRVAKYKRGMAMSALSLAALFPTFGPNYPKQALKVVQSRQIFAPVIGIPGGITSQDHSGTFGSMRFDVKTYDQIDALRRLMELYIQPLKSAYFYIYESDWKVRATYVNDYIGKRGSNTGLAWGMWSSDPSVIYTSALGAAGYAPNVVGVRYSHGGSYTKGMAPPNTNAYAPFEFKYPGYKLHSVSAYGLSKAPDTADSVMFGFRPVLLENEANQLLTDTALQIPAEIGITDVVPAFGRTEEPINGQDAIIIWESFTSGFGFTYTVDSPQKQKYKIIYRIANNLSASTVSLTYNNQTFFTDILNTSLDPNGVRGNYGSYTLVEGPIIEFSQGTNIFKLRSQKGEFAIDSIIFSPVS